MHSPCKRFQNPQLPQIALHIPGGYSLHSLRTPSFGKMVLALFYLRVVKVFLIYFLAVFYFVSVWIDFVLFEAFSACSNGVHKRSLNRLIWYMGYGHFCLKWYQLLFYYSYEIVYTTCMSMHFIFAWIFEMCVNNIFTRMGLTLICRLKNEYYSKTIFFPTLHLWLIFAKKKKNEIWIL